MPTSRGRSGRPWRSRQAQVYAEETHCHICGKYVDQYLPKNHAMSRTVDHLVEMWQGGDPLPPRHLLRLAHRACNTAKSNRLRGNKQPRTEVHVDLQDI